MDKNNIEKLHDLVAGNRLEVIADERLTMGAKGFFLTMYAMDKGYIPKDYTFRATGEELQSYVKELGDYDHI